MTLLGRRISVAVPDTVLEEKDSLKDKTNKLGTIARACSIYGVDLVQIFGDNTADGDSGLIVKVLRYLETPQYLRRRLYPLDETLRFAGTLPPLRIPSHKPKVKIEELGAGEFREGVANGDGTVDIGLDQLVRIEGNVPQGRVTVRVTSKFPLKGEVVHRERVQGYWGYKVEVASMHEVFAVDWLKIATSKLGQPLGEGLPALRTSVLKSERVKLIFGSPSRGLFEIVGRDLQRRSDFVVNLFPEQDVVTVRTEEAIFAGLNLLSVLIADKA